LPVTHARAQSSVRGTWAEVDLRAVRHNLACVRSAVAPAGVLAICKADGYGHGAVEVARAAEAGGAWGAGVATVEEALDLRDAGVGGRIVVLGTAYDGAHDEVVRHDLDAVVAEPADLAAFAGAARRAGTRARLHVKVDTGMARLGVSPGGLAALLEPLGDSALVLAGAMTHLACADASDEAPTYAQLAFFDGALGAIRAAGLSPETVHTANSAALLRFPAARGTLVRPGLALYGALPSAEVPDPGLRPALAVRTRVMALRDVPAGATVSYGGLWRAERPSRIATVPVGYADGYPRRLSGRAEVLVRGVRAPVAGAVCMDLTMIDVTGVPGAAAGDEVVLLGAQGAGSIGVSELAAWADAIPYEIFCGLGRRLPRRYTE
jgi:alanine racemase